MSPRGRRTLTPPFCSVDQTADSAGLHTCHRNCRSARRRRHRGVSRGVTRHHGRECELRGVRALGGHCSNSDLCPTAELTADNLSICVSLSRHRRMLLLFTTQDVRLFMHSVLQCRVPRFSTLARARDGRVPEFRALSHGKSVTRTLLARTLHASSQSALARHWATTHTEGMAQQGQVLQMRSQGGAVTITISGFALMGAATYVCEAGHIDTPRDECTRLQTKGGSGNSTSTHSKCTEAHSRTGAHHFFQPSSDPHELRFHGASVCREAAVGALL